jgi:hypothetical protein
MTPKESMKEYCRQCLNTKQHRTEAVKNCGGDKAACGPCPFYPHRLKRVSVKIFRKNCLYCMGGSRVSVDECNVESCPCYPYRFGKSPVARKGNPDALRKYRENGAGLTNNF